MKLQLDATPEELAEKGPALIKALADRLAPHNPDLAESLEKALRKEPSLKYPMLRDLHEASADAYQRQSLDMIKDIERALKGEETKALRKAQQKTTEDSNNDDPDYDPESGEPILNPTTGMSPSEEAADKEANPEDYETENEDTEKSVNHLHDHLPVDVDGDDDELAEPEGAEEDDEEEPPVRQPVKSGKVTKAFVDHTKPPADKDAKLYAQAIEELKKLDPELTDSDFKDVGGQYFGWSTNQLIDLAREKKK